MFGTREELEQDLKDLLRIAKDFAPVERCTECGRYTRDVYVCIHCGYDEGEPDEE